MTEPLPQPPDTALARLVQRAMPIGVRGPGAEPSHGGLNLKDFFFAVFRHKSLVLFCAALGLVAAALFYFFYPPVYESDAKLLVRYVVERSAVDSVDSNSANSSRNSDSAIASEVEILTSWDLAVQVADVIGPKRLLPRSHEPPTKELAALTIARGLTVGVGKGTNIIFVSYKNRDPQLAPLVLDELIRQYFNKHLEVHRSAGAFDFVTQQIDRVKARLGQTEDALAPLKTKLGIISLADSKTELGAELAKTHDQLHDAEADLAEQQARVKEIEHAQSGAGDDSADAEPSPPSTSSVAPAKSSPATPATSPPVLATKSTAPGPSASPAAASPAPGKPPKASESDLEKYKMLVARVGQLRQSQVALLGKYTTENSQVKRIQGQLNEAERDKLALEKKFPDLPSRLPATTTDRAAGGIDLASERARLAGLKAKVAALKTQLASVEGRMKQLGQMGPEISELERQKDLEENNYKYFEGTLEKARVDEALDPSKIPNISAVQKASPPMEVTTTRNKITFGLAAGGLALGLALALLRGLFLDRSLKRPLEIEEELQTSLLLSIPYRDAKHVAVSPYSPPDDSTPAAKGRKTNIAPWEANHFIRTYCESLRDRLGLYFELNHLTHKPKLVGVTSFSAGAGTSTLAAGLAAALSETGEGKVLLVDVNLGPEDVHPFFKGRPAYPLKVALSARQDDGLRGGEFVSGKCRLSQVRPGPAWPEEILRHDSQPQGERLRLHHL